MAYILIEVVHCITDPSLSAGPGVAPASTSLGVGGGIPDDRDRGRRQRP
jgi:hypothetical protein